MAIRRDVGARLKHGMFRAGFAPMNVYNAMMRVGLGALKREVVRGQGQGLLKRLFLSFDDVDWPRTAAYSLGNVGQIFLNVAGREPQGSVQPGAAYEATRTRIVERLAQLRDPHTGELVVETIYRREDVYAGEQLACAPDILFIPRRLEYFGFGEYEFGSNKVIEAMRRGISGTHRLTGVFLAYGAAVKPGVVVDGARLVDLAPTLLHILGEPIPSTMDGRVLEEALVDGFQPARGLGETPIWQAPVGHNGQGLSDEDAQIVAQRLRSLGYVG
jgi:predicted AlkP superfamily phosphohydrolase/phosphomutase